MDNATSIYIFLAPIQNYSLKGFVLGGPLIRLPKVNRLIETTFFPTTTQSRA